MGGSARAQLLPSSPPRSWDLFLGTTVQTEKRSTSPSAHSFRAALFIWSLVQQNPHVKLKSLHIHARQTYNHRFNHKSDQLFFNTLLKVVLAVVWAMLPRTGSGQLFMGKNRALKIYIYTTVQKFGVIQTISCLPWKLTFSYQINWKLNRTYSQDIDKVRNND